ncbi:MAG: polysaccharide deacetylase family protein [Bacteroidetes bacterium]|nr:polysaccharide deacetylase family protein [Bacteroidota bacterium]
MENGKFIISLDFELFWGVRDKRTIENYGANILGVQKAIPAMLQLFEKYNTRVTFSTVGLLFAANRDELLQYCPAVRPEYTDTKLSPYPDLATIGFNEEDDPWHFGYSLLKQIQLHPEHEIGTHTFCHYYCLEPGQTATAFLHDLQAAKNIAAKMGIQVRSLVFPRNQFNEEYLAVCREAGIESYRGNPTSWLYAGRNKNDESLFRRMLRIIDTYINLTGHHCYEEKAMRASPVMNIPGSRFLRPYSRKLSFLDGLRLRRIKQAMKHAAKNKLMYHLWWHPHNFGANLAENIAFLDKVLQYYTELNKQYGFTSITMSGLSDELKAVGNG